MPQWSVTLAGNEYALVPSTPALVAIETATGCSLFSLVQAGTEGGLSLDQLAHIIGALVVAPEGGDALFPPEYAATRGRLPLPALAREKVIAAIVGAGVMNVVPYVLLPISAAMTGKANADGTPLDETLAA